METEILVKKLREATALGDSPVGPGFGVIVDKKLLSDAADKIEELRADVDEWILIFDMFNDRENRHGYLEWWRKRNGQSDLAYPDGDEIYKDFWEIMNDLKSACEVNDALTWVMCRSMLKEKWGFDDEQKS